MQIKKERKQTYRYSYTQLVAIKPAKAPGQDSIGTGGQNSIGANSVDGQTGALCRTFRFDALLAFTTGEVAQGRCLVAEMVAASR